MRKKKIWWKSENSKRPTINFCPTFLLFLDRFLREGTAFVPPGTKLSKRMKSSVLFLGHYFFMQKRWNGRKNGAKEGERTSVRPCFLTPQIASSRGVWKGNTVGKQRGAFIPAQPGTNPGIASKNQGLLYIFSVSNQSKNECFRDSSDLLLYLLFFRNGTRG